MIRNPRRNDEALTGLELIIILIVLIGVTALLLVHIGGGGIPGWARTFPGGLVADSMYISGDHIRPVGSTIGFSAVSLGQTRTAIIYARPDPGRLGSIQMMVSLFMGDTGAIDMDRLNVSWNRRGSYEQIRKTDARPLVCPNWTITGKYNMLPGRSADSDNWLEPGEEFMILACPSSGLAPGQDFTLTMYPDGIVVPLTLSRTTPPRIQPVMNLG